MNRLRIAFRVLLSSFVNVTCAAAALAAASLPSGVSPNWSAGVQQQIAESEYRVTWQGESGWQAPNRAHNLRTSFTEGGIRVSPRTHDAPPWEWALSFVGAGRSGDLLEIAPAALRADGNRIEYDRGGIVEWYVNAPRGLEQGFTLSAPPPREGGKEASLELSLTGTLDPSFSTDGQAIDFKAPGGAIVLHYAALAVTDAHGTLLPARMEGFVRPGLRGIRIVYDDAAAVYPVTVDPLTTTPAWTGVSSQDGSWFGYSVATSGDVNGDGYSDVIVGAPLFDNGQPDEGCAFVYLGSPSGLGAAPAWSAEGNQDNAFFGWSAATAGDANGDGYDDVIVGAFQHTNGQFQEGRAYAYYGSASGLATVAGWSAESNQASAAFGWAVSTAGDVNGDGYADVIVGASGYDGTGRAFVYLGSSTGLAPSAAWTTVGSQGFGFGGSVATAGDVNGDGYADVIVGAELQSNGQFNEGRAFAYLGSASGLALTPAWTAESDQAGANFGHAVSTAGDVNGDGYADVIVGAPGYDNVQNGEGRAFLYLGSATGLLASIAWTAEIDQPGAAFGNSVSTAGDINGDGFADVIVGSNLYDRAQVYLGSTSGPAAQPTWSPTGPPTGSHFGFSVGTAGDVNGDGYSDVVVGGYTYYDGASYPGAAFAYYGSASALTTSPAWAAEGDGTPVNHWSVATAGDVNGDGYSDVVVGASYLDNLGTVGGRAYVYLGSAAGLSTHAAWIGKGSDLGVQGFGWSVGTAGDVNGDGYSDLVVSAVVGQDYLYQGSPSGLQTTPSWASPVGGDRIGTAGDVNGDGYSDVILGAPGPVYVFQGSSSGLSTTAAWMAEGDQEWALFGDTVATAGDVNGDGYSDVIVGAPGYDTLQTNEGRAFLYLGSASGLAKTPAWTADSGASGAWFGNSATAGDVNGDGYADVIVGAYGYTFDQLEEGRVSVYLGSASGLATNPSWSADGNVVEGYFGGSVGTAGDVNGDGYADVIVGAEGQSNDQSREGRAYAYLGSASGLALTPAWTAEGDQALAGFGHSVSTAGDVNGDGYADVIVGLPLAVHVQNVEVGAYLYYGGRGDGLDRVPRQARTDSTSPIALLGKSDSETSFRLRERGRTPAGRGSVYLQSEVKPLGSAFNGSGVSLSAPQDTGVPGLAGSETSFDQQTTGLSEGTFYHWRTRIVSTNPFFPRSPWMSLAGNNVTETKFRTSGCIDRDGDGYGALGDASCLSLRPDCNDSDPLIWGTPDTTRNLRFMSKTVMSWDPPADPGTPPSGLVYDILRSGVASNFLSVNCLASDAMNRTATDVALPTAGNVFFYLVRARTLCPAGLGSLGTNSAGAERVGSCRAGNGAD